MHFLENNLIFFKHNKKINNHFETTAQLLALKLTITTTTTREIFQYLFRQG